MDEKFKEKILACITVVTDNGGYYLLPNDKIEKLLAIINEEIEEKSNEAFERGKFIHISFDN
jgi:hypothetical protein